MLTPIHFVVATATLATLVVCVSIHGVAAAFLMRRLPALKLHAAATVILMVLGLFVAHVVEIWLFGILSWTLVQFEGAGAVVGQQDVMTVLDHVYFSAVSYTTLGYGEVYPVGPIRFIFGTEALTGFMLITWSASITFLEMQRFW
ncbi:ion channel [Halospina denitrificans]|uniref:Ion channel n=1 Tax=Halospina denitrificans TaxID=332522 RepID=A0A4V3EQY3_9GAMM|nr:ion channel [Halospina denitrificans]TDT41388.1 ion channel [Halospina denitrificans]